MFKKPFFITLFFLTWLCSTKAQSSFTHSKKPAMRALLERESKGIYCATLNNRYGWCFLMKKCNQCGRLRGFKHFHTSQIAIDGLRTCCKFCDTKQFMLKRINKKRRNVFVYVIVHPLFESYVKIGQTVNPQKRLISYNTGCPFRKYRYHFVKKCKYPDAVEVFFKQNMPGNGYEWFKISKSEAVETIEELLKIQNEKTQSWKLRRIKCGIY